MGAAFDKLSNQKWRRFVTEYLDTLNQTEAYQRAYGCKREVARSNGHRLMTNPDIKAAIEEGLDEGAMSRAEIVHRLGRHARASLAPALDLTDPQCPTINLKGLEEAGALDLVKKVRTTTARKGDEVEVLKVEIEMVDSQSALDKLAKAHGVYRDGPTGTQTDPVHHTVKHEFTEDDLVSIAQILSDLGALGSLVTEKPSEPDDSHDTA